MCQASEARAPCDLTAPWRPDSIGRVSPSCRFQVEALKTSAQIEPDSLGVAKMLETRARSSAMTDDDHITARVRAYRRPLGCPPSLHRLRRR